MVDIDETIRYFADKPAFGELFRILPLADMIESSLSLSLKESAELRNESLPIDTRICQEAEEKGYDVDYDAAMIFSQDLQLMLDAEIARKSSYYWKLEDFIFERWLGPVTIMMVRVDRLCPYW